MPFGDYFKLPENFRERRSAPNRMEGLNFGQKLNYMGQFEGPSLMALGAGIMEGEPEQGWRDMAKIQAGYQANFAGEQEENRVREQTMQYLIANGIDPTEAQAAAQNPNILKHIFELQEQQVRADHASQVDPSAHRNGTRSPAPTVRRNGSLASSITRGNSMRWKHLGGRHSSRRVILPPPRRAAR